MTRLADTLAARLATHRGAKVGWDVIRGWAVDADTSLASAPDSRARILAAVTELVDAGTVTLPSPRGGGWDRRAHPPVPAWIRRTRPDDPDAAPATPAARPGDRVWPAALETAAAAATRPDETVILDQVATWLAANPDPVPGPVEERSLQVFGDEKRLTTLLGTRLFTTPGGLTLDLLAAYRVPLPFASQHVLGRGPTILLVAENAATWHSLLTAARALPADTRPDLHVGWGSGRAFESSVTSIPVLDPAPTRVTYFGDLDLAGLQIPTAAAATASAAGLPAVQPATALYQFLLDRGTRRPDPTNPRRDAPNQVLAWLTESLHDDVTGLLRSGQRIAQETLTRADLRDAPALLTALTGDPAG